MSKSQPLVSVIMPIYNCENYLDTSLGSIIGQTYKNLEIIAIDDCSTDKSWDIIQKFAKKDSRIRALRNEENLRLTKTLNKAIRHSTGVYIARMDGDDERVADSIEKQVAFLEEHPEVVVVGGAAEICDSSMNKLNYRKYETTDIEIRKKIFRHSPYAHGAIVVRKNALDNPPYQIDWAEDYDLYFRLGRRGKMANLEEVVYRLRTHSVSISQSKQRFMEKVTLYLRIKAVMEYGYEMTFGDKVYFILQYLTMYLMTPKFRFWLFNKMRSSK